MYGCVHRVYILGLSGNYVALALLSAFAPCLECVYFVCVCVCVCVCVFVCVCVCICVCVVSASSYTPLSIL